ncbi:hypothetical protein C2G38_2121203, partial [Gigaspora rosea]
MKMKKTLEFLNQIHYGFITVNVLLPFQNRMYKAKNSVIKQISVIKTSIFTNFLIIARRLYYNIIKLILRFIYMYIRFISFFFIIALYF